MIFVIGITLAVVTVPLTGGRWWYLDHERLRTPGLIAASVATQFVIVNLPDGAVARTGHIGSYLLLAAFIARNRDLQGIWLLGLGAACNFVAIAANGGVMPVSPEAWAAVGAHLDTDRFTNAAPIEDAHLALFGDVMAMPTWVPGALPFSAGDVILVIGLIAVIHALCRSSLARDREVSRHLAAVSLSCEQPAPEPR